MSRSLIPSVGRIVHYFARNADGSGHGPYAAIVTGVQHEPGETIAETISECSLRVFLPNGKDIAASGVFEGPHQQPRDIGQHWAWPPRD